MPHTDCVKYNGKIYCYDQETDRVTVYKTEQIALADCPERVLQALFKLRAGTIVDLEDTAKGSEVN
jgi:hypothetical protein